MESNEPVYQFDNYCLLFGKRVPGNFKSNDQIFIAY